MLLSIFRLLLCLLPGLLLRPAAAAQLPVPAGGDARVLYLDYKADDVAIIKVQRGAATRIVLAAQEHILPDGAATGLGADCAKPEHEWCMRADAGGNQVLIRPKERATANNLELRTDKRDYSFRFEVVPDSTKQHKGDGKPRHAAAQPMYRVIFRYSDAPAPSTTSPAARPAPTPSELADAARPSPRNWRYTMQVLPGGEDIVPSLAFDDGRFTYFQFPANREMPTIYFVSSAGEEGRVNFHIDPLDPAMVVVERMGRRFVLRLGDAVVGIWNEGFDAYGVPPTDGTTVEGLIRIMR
ncbi:TrbG/VirB9 family P-type conjugative transfer protein [Duganella levis]|uniref:TrbG/VirB9 family P-type conjugative transfer protein n=1 Tax=Duganella levis TaxID=2692169 RepID=A0ABW9VT38_9BURK|nr:TrbG/VirB9 family P-type conjugative transfer protein [Duganella levis]MYN24793.1 TrbG/VirB9 family P-type conjugative transfer protein [Duganella levis]